MARIDNITVPAPENQDPIRTWLEGSGPNVIVSSETVGAWLAEAARARVKCTLTELATTTHVQGEVIIQHKDIVEHKGTLYKIVATDGVVCAKTVPPGAVLPESIKLKARSRSDNQEAALQEWLKAAEKSSCSVMHLGEPTSLASLENAGVNPMNAIAIVLHRYSGNHYFVMFTAGIGKDPNLFAVRTR